MPSPEETREPWLDDPAFQSLDRDLHVLADATKPSVAFLVSHEQEAQRLVDASGSVSRPAPDGVDVIATRAPSPFQLSRRWLLRQRWQTMIGLATAAALIFSVLGVSLWNVTRPESVSAAEIVARAEQTANGGNTGKLQSYQGVITSAQRASSQGMQTRFEQRVWYQAPGSERTENYAPSQPAPGGTTQTPPPASSSVIINIITPTTRWEYQPQQLVARRLDPPPGGSPGTAYGATNLQALLKNAGQKADVKLLGSEMYIGRSAYVLDLTTALDPASSLPEGSHYKIWVDQETYITLGSETRDPQGTLLDSSTFSTLQINQPIDAERFTVVPPPGTRVVDARRQQPPPPDQYQTQLQDAGARAPFLVFTPAMAPEGLVARPPLAETQLVALSYQSPPGSPDATSDFSHNVPPLTLTERAATAGDADVPAGTERVQVPGASVAWFQPSYRNTGNFGIGGYVVLVRDGTLITLAGSFQGLTREQLLQIAGSLVRVGSGATGGSSATSQTQANAATPSPTGTPVALPGGAAAPLAGQALVDALQGGGYVIFFRNVQPADDGGDPEINTAAAGCSPIRNLTAQGLAVARDIGGTFNRLAIPAGMILSSRYCPAVVTATMAFNGVGWRSELTEPRDPTDGAAREQNARYLRAVLAKRPTGMNTIVIGQQANLTDALGPDFALAEGEAAIFAPDDHGGFALVARVLPDGWDSLHGSP